MNTSDPDSRNVKTSKGWIEGYNAQAVSNERQSIFAAEITNQSPDFGQVGPMTDAVGRDLAAAGVTDTPEVLLADAGYWHHAQMQQIVAAGTQVIVPPDADRRKAPRPGLRPRPLRLHETRPGDRARQRALRQPPRDHRADFGRHQIQPRHEPLLTPRTRRLPQRTA